jgi:hypothetical protein
MLDVTDTADTDSRSKLTNWLMEFKQSLEIKLIRWFEINTLWYEFQYSLVIQTDRMQILLLGNIDNCRLNRTQDQLCL